MYKDALEIYDEVRRITELQVQMKQEEYERKLGMLNEAIYTLLLHHTEQLTWLLYRLDVREQDTKRAFEEEDVHRIAAALTQLIMKREIEKSEARKHFRRNVEEIG